MRKWGGGANAGGDGSELGRRHPGRQPGSSGRDGMSHHLGVSGESGIGWSDLHSAAWRRGHPEGLPLSL